jgi:oligoendopeptidase F
LERAIELLILKAKEHSLLFDNGHTLPNNVHSIEKFARNAVHLARVLGYGDIPEFERLIGLFDRPSTSALARLEQLYSSFCTCLTIHDTTNNIDKSIFDYLGDLRSGNSDIRSQSYQAINTIFKTYDAMFRDFANAYFTLRADQYQSSAAYQEDYTQTNAISNTQVNQFISAISNHRQQIHRNLEACKPWDFYYFPDVNKTFSAGEALQLIENALIDAIPCISHFIKCLTENNCLILDPTIAIGEASCLSFPNSLPVILLDFRGTLYDVIILAHELGHAFFDYLILDCHVSETFIPRCLIEFPSIAFEQLTLRYLERHAPTQEAARFVRIRDGAYSLLDFPMRFDIEHAILDDLITSRRCDYSSISTAAASRWYGEQYSDTYAWLSRPHLYMHNFPMNHIQYFVGFIAVQAFFSITQDGNRLINAIQSLANTTLSKWISELNCFASEEAFIAAGIDYYLDGR